MRSPGNARTRSFWKIGQTSSFSFSIVPCSIFHIPKPGFYKALLIVEVAYVARRAGAKRGGGGGREKGKREGSGVPSPQSPIFPFLPTPYPFGRLLRRLGPIISDHTKQHCRKKQLMITPEAWTPVKLLIALLLTIVLSLTHRIFDITWS